MMHAPLSREDRKSKKTQQQYFWRHRYQRGNKVMGWIGGTVLLGIVLSVIGSLAITLIDTSWRKLVIVFFVMTHPLLVVGLFAGLILLFVFFWWKGSNEVSQEGNQRNPS